MSEKVVFLDWYKRIYVANRKDFEEMLQKNPIMVSRVCQLVTFYESDSYVGLMQQLIDNGVID